MPVRVTNDRLIIEIPATQPAELYADLSGELVTLLQEVSDPERAITHNIWNVLELTRALVADPDTFADSKRPNG